MLCAVLASLGTVPVYADAVTEINWGDSQAAEAENNETVNVSELAAESKKDAGMCLALGNDLTSEQLATVLSLMELSQDDLEGCSIVKITNAQEHEYLDSYVNPSVIGTRALSSVLVKEMEEGHGVVVTTKNINYCTEGMYRNALLTAGVKDAEIVVAGPTSISGTAALIGALQAYDNMHGTDVTQTALDTALDELVTTGELADALGDSEEVSDMIAFVKAEIAGKKLDTKEEIEAVVVEAAKDYGVTLTDEEINKIINLMLKIKELGLDYNTLLDQAEDLYAKFGDKLSVKDLESLAQGDTGEIVKSAIGNFFTGVFDKVTGFIKGLIKS